MDYNSDVDLNKHSNPKRATELDVRKVERAEILFKRILKRLTVIGFFSEITGYGFRLICGFAISWILSMAMGRQFAELKEHSIWAGLLIIIGALFTLVAGMLLEKEREKAAFLLERHVCEAVIEERIAAESAGETDTLLTKDTETIRKYYEETLPRYIASSLIIVACCVLLLRQDVRLVGIIGVAGCLQFIPIIFYEKWAKEVYQQLRCDEETYCNWILEGMNGIKTLKSYQQEKWFIDRFLSNCKVVVDSGNRENRMATIEDILSSLVKTILTYGSYLLLGIFVLFFHLSVQEIPICIVLAESLLEAMSVIAVASASKAQCREAIKRCSVDPQEETKIERTKEVLMEGEEVTKRIGEKQVIQCATFQIKEGDRVLLQGKNGGGKTTFLRLLAGLDKPDTGNLRIAMREEAVALQEEVSLNMEVAELADAVSKNAGILKNDFYKVLEALGENNLENKKIQECSGGQCKKCYLAFALVKPADMLILDEPTNHLDDKSVQYLMDFLNEYKKTLVVCSHDERIEKLSWTKKYVMEEGILHEQ